MGASRREGLGRGGASEGPKSARPSRRGRGGLVLFAEQTKRASLRYGSSNLGAPQPIWTTSTCLLNADRGRCDHAIRSVRIYGTPGHNTWPHLLHPSRRFDSRLGHKEKAPAFGRG